MRAARLIASGEMVLSSVERPVAGPGDLLIKVLAAGICGSDRHMFHGEYPTAKPVTLGHEFSGLITETGEGVTGFCEGDLVTVDPNIACGRCRACMQARPNLCEELQAIGVTRDGGFADYVVVPQKQAFRLPPDLDPVHGAFCEPIACCLHAIDKAGIRPGDSVAILGGGVIGLIMVQLARLSGAARVALVTRQAFRRKTALELGASHAFEPGDDGAVGAIRQTFDGGPDIVIECAGVAETLQSGLAMLRPGGTFVLFGVTPAGTPVPVLPFDLLVREIAIRPAYLNPFTHQRAADLVARGLLDLDALVTRTIGLDDVPRLVAASPEPGEIKFIVRPG